MTTGRTRIALNKLLKLKYMNELQYFFEEHYREDYNFRQKVRLFYHEFVKQDVETLRIFRELSGYGTRAKKKGMYLDMWLNNLEFRDKVLNTDLSEYIQSKEVQYVYVVTNPAFKEHVKIGRTSNPKKRLSSYNICSPFKDFKYEFCEEIENPKLVEDYFRNKYKSPNEWYNISVNQAVDEIETLLQLISNN